LYIDLKTNGYLKKYSVNDYIQLLTDMKKIKINNAWHPNEITGQTSRMIKKLGFPIEEYNT